MEDMKRSLKDLTDFSVETIDGTKGKVKDFLFDENSWVIRYLEVDFGTFFNDKRVLIPGFFLTSPVWEDKKFPVDLTTENIENCPAPQDVKTVSREYEEKLSRHYGYSFDWTYSVAPGAIWYPPRPMAGPERIREENFDIDEEHLQSSLRSFTEVKGYTIHAIDGKMGHVEDFIADDSDWQIVYMIADTSNWLPWSKKVILAVSWLKKISYAEGEIFMDLHTDTIKNAPEFHSDFTFDSDNEKSLVEYYNKTPADIHR